MDRYICLPYSCGKGEKRIPLALGERAELQSVGPTTWLGIRVESINDKLRRMMRWRWRWRCVVMQ